MIEFINGMISIAWAIAARCCLFLLAASVASCAVVPGLQVELDVATSVSPIHVTEHEKERVVEVLDGQSVVQKFRVVALDAVNLMQYSKPSAALAGDELGNINPASKMPEYRVGPGDVLQIIVWDHPELTSPAGDFRDPVSTGRLVASDGSVYYPFAGALKAEGFTPMELRQVLTEKLAGVIVNPQVDVRVVAYRSKRIQVIGEVEQPGMVTLDDTPKGVLEAISERGGLTELASRRALSLIRGGERYELNFEGLVSGDRPSPNPPLLAGDIVHIPHKDAQQVFVLGETGQQTAVTLAQGESTLMRVLASAGGLDQARGEDAGILIFRRATQQDSIASVFVLDMSKPQGILLAGEFVLLPKDVVYVKATNFAKYNSIISQLLPTISAIFQVDALVNRSR